MATSTSPAIKNACNAVLDDLEAVVIALHAVKSTSNMLGGIGIDFANHSWELPDYYTDFAFASQGWLELLQAYWAVHGSV